MWKPCSGDNELHDKTIQFGAIAMQFFVGKPKLWTISTWFLIKLQMMFLGNLFEISFWFVYISYQTEKQFSIFYVISIIYCSNINNERQKLWEMQWI